MNIQHNEELRDRLASEYVLGTLIGGARRRLETWMKADAALRRAVAEWQDRLTPMVEFATAVQPPPSVWSTIVKRLELQSPVKRKLSYWLSLRDDVSFWRGLGMLSTTVVLILLSVMMMRPAADVPVTSFVAMLNDDNAQLIAVATGGADKNRMTIKVVQPLALASDKSLELWAITKDGKVRSVGLIDEQGSHIVDLADATSPDAAPILAVTLEPKGGSGYPNKATGPILYKGAWVKI
jgi:anti-sigma-K factor RskA